MKMGFSFLVSSVVAVLSFCHWAGAGTLADPAHESERLSEVSDELASELKVAADQVKAMTRADEVLVLVGQSPAYLLPFLEKERQAFGVAMSGRVWIQDGITLKSQKLRRESRFTSWLHMKSPRFVAVEGTPPKMGHLDLYCRYLAVSGLSEEVIRSSRVVLVDHSHTGQSITTFAKILNFCGKVTEPKPFPFINLISALQSRGDWIIDPPSFYITVRGRVILKHLIEWANDYVPRVIPRFPHWEWSQFPDFDSEALSEGRQWMTELRNRAGSSS
jgi:hypothetical protein